MTYKIVRYRFRAPSKVIKRGLTLQEAQEHCTDPTTRGPGWYDGYTAETSEENGGGLAEVGLAHALAADTIV